MARRRFFVEEVHHGRAELAGEEARHLARVLRVEAGQRFEISDNARVYLAEVANARKDRVVFDVVEELTPVPLPARFTVLGALIKFDRFELMVEKATELGAERIIPVVAERSEKGLDRAAAKRLPRWRRIALETSQQARRARLPEVDLPLSFPEAVSCDSRYRFFLDEEPATPSILLRLPDPPRRASSDTLALLVGPEGGWTDDERSRAASAGWSAVSLSPQVLRSETAAVAALAVLMSAWQAGHAGLS